MVVWDFAKSKKSVWFVDADTGAKRKFVDEETPSEHGEHEDEPVPDSDATVPEAEEEHVAADDGDLEGNNDDDDDDEASAKANNRPKRLRRRDLSAAADDSD